MPHWAKKTASPSEAMERLLGRRSVARAVARGCQHSDDEVRESKNAAGRTNIQAAEFAIVVLSHSTAAGTRSDATRLRDRWKPLEIVRADREARRLKRKGYEALQQREAEAVVAGAQLDISYSQPIRSAHASSDSFFQGLDFCPGQQVDGVTSHKQMNYTEQPVLFHLGRDPGEKYPIPPHDQEYIDNVGPMFAIYREHKRDLVPGKPQLNWCDNAAMEWAPPGCQQIGRCLPVPPSSPYRCPWLF